MAYLVTENSKTDMVEFALPERLCTRFPVVKCLLLSQLQANSFTSLKLQAIRYPVCFDTSLSLGGTGSEVGEVSWPCLWGGPGVGVEPVKVLEQESNVQRCGLLSIHPGMASGEGTGRQGKVIWEGAKTTSEKRKSLNGSGGASTFKAEREK